MSWLPREMVVVPIDFSEDSLAAVPIARELVAGGSHLCLIHVLQDGRPFEDALVWETFNDGERIDRVEQELRLRFAGERYEGLHTLAVLGDPGKKIPEVAEKLGADLIVIPSHGRTGLQRILLGSVSEQVIRNARCPVLVLRSSPQAPK